MVFIWKWGFFGSRKYNCLFSQHKARKFVSFWTLWNKFQEIFVPFSSRSNFFSILLCYVQTKATTPNIVGPTMLGVVASVLAVVYKQTQRLPTMLGPAVHRGRIQLIRLWKLEFGSHIGACMAPTMLEELCKRLQHCCATLRRSRNKRNARSCWPTLLRPLARGFTPEITGSSPIASFWQSLVHW